MSRRERIDEVVEQVLNPLLAKDGGTLEVVELDGRVLRVRLTGALHGCPGTAYVKRGVIEPALASAAGPGLEVVYERPAFTE